MKGDVVERFWRVRNTLPGSDTGGKMTTRPKFMREPFGTPEVLRDLEVVEYEVIEVGATPAMKCRAPAKRKPKAPKADRP